MNTLMMFARGGVECCQNQLGTGNIGIGNTSTMATLNKLPAALKHGGK